MKERTNEQWLMELRGANPDEALGDLYDLLVRGLRAALGSYGGGVDAYVEDFAQEALLRITGNLDSFRGESRFTTWAQKIAMNVALTELKRRRWRDVSLQDLLARRMGTNQNALYKLLHDARRKLKRRMEAAGLSPQEVLAAFDEG